MTLKDGGRGKSGSGHSGGDGSSAGTKAKPRAPNRDLVHVTPEMAKTWLATDNLANRKLKPGLVEEYARLMDAGEWDPFRSPICFDEEGQLFEGQHRLNAVVLHGRSVWMEIVRDLPIEQRFSDGGQPRTLADYLVIAKICETKNGVRVAAVIETIASLLAEAPRKFSARRGADVREAIALAREYQASIAWAMETFPSSGSFAPVVGAFVLAYESRGDEVHDFASYFLSAERTALHPACALDAMIAEARTTHRKPGPYRLEIAERTLSAIYAAAKKKKLSVVRRNAQAREYFRAKR